MPISIVAHSGICPPTVGAPCVIIEIHTSQFATCGLWFTRASISLFTSWNVSGKYCAGTPLCTWTATAVMYNCLNLASEAGVCGVWCVIWKSWFAKIHVVGCGLMFHDLFQPIPDPVPHLPSTQTKYQAFQSVPTLRAVPQLQRSPLVRLPSTERLTKSMQLETIWYFLYAALNFWSAVSNGKNKDPLWDNRLTVCPGHRSWSLHKTGS